MEALLALVPLPALAAAAAVTLVAGFVKGAVGFAMPLLMISGMATFLDPKVALAGLVLPTLASNFAQALRFGARAALSAGLAHRRYIAIVCLGIVISAQAVQIIPARAMYLVLGLPVTLLSLIQLAGWRFRIAPERRWLADWGIGAVAGGLGGLSGIWGPPTVLYLLALDTPRDRHMIVQGVVYSLGSVVLLGAHLGSGVLNATTLPFSAALLAPAFLGMVVGFRVGDRLEQRRFRQATLVVLVVAGLNLLRRGLVAQ